MLGPVKELGMYFKQDTVPHTEHIRILYWCLCVFVWLIEYCSCPVDFLPDCLKHKLENKINEVQCITYAIKQRSV